jgi:hypothetical protein
MGIDYDAVAGYGVKINDNLTDEGIDLLENTYEDDYYDFIENELVGEITYETIGSHYSGEVEYVIILSDPLREGVYDKFIEMLGKNTHLLENIEPKWICEVCIS